MLLQIFMKLMKLSITQLSIMVQSDGFHSKLLGPLLKTGLQLMENMLKPLAKVFWYDYD